MVPAELSRSALRIEILCEVIDNFGDAGISWRLATQLCAQWGAQVTLIIDQPKLLARWREAARLAGRATPQVVDLRTAIESAGTDASSDASAPDLFIAMLGSRVPEPMRARLSAHRTPWIRYEYLSAEPWIDGCHGLPSPKPDGLATEWFYYPGYSSASGGLLREALLDEELRHWIESERSDWLAARGLDTPPGVMRFCLFGYAEPRTAELAQALAALTDRCVIFINRGLADQLADASLLSDAVLPAQCELRIHDWLDQGEFDRLLCSCDLSLVRGEDSWVRAQWTGQPFLWQAYRQDEQFHLTKLNAWLNRLLTDRHDPAARAIRRLMDAINQGTGHGEPESLRPALTDYLANLTSIRAIHRQWCKDLLTQAPLVDRLARFARDQLQLPV